MGTKHLTEADRLRARTLFFDAGLPKSRICEIMSVSLNQVKLAIREKTPKPRTGRPRRKPRPDEGAGTSVGTRVAIRAGADAGADGCASANAGASASASASINNTSTSTTMTAAGPLVRAPAPPTLSGRIHKPEQYEVPLPTSPFHREWPLMGTPARLSSMSSSASRAASASAAAAAAAAALAAGRTAGPSTPGGVSHGSILSSAPSLLPPSSALYTASPSMSLVSPPAPIASSAGASTASSTNASTVSVPSLIIPPLQY